MSPCGIHWYRGHVETCDACAEAMQRTLAAVAAEKAEREAGMPGHYPRLGQAEVYRRHNEARRRKTRERKKRCARCGDAITTERVTPADGGDRDALQEAEEA